MTASAVYGFIGVLLGSATTAVLTVYRERLLCTREREARKHQRQQDRENQRNTFQRQSLLELAHGSGDCWYTWPGPASERPCLAIRLAGSALGLRVNGAPSGCKLPARSWWRSNGAARYVSMPAQGGRGAHRLLYLAAVRRRQTRAGTSLDLHMISTSPAPGLHMPCICWCPARDA